MTAARMQLEDWLDDLCVRFIINLPQEDLSSVARICFQVEEAQWFYEDFIRPLDPNLPSMPLRIFCLRIFQHCPLLASFSVENHTKAFEEFLQYKTRVPVRGAIMLNQAMDSVVLVKGWKKGANWSFPRGKINKDEDDLDCAIREVYEETGLDLRAAGLVPTEKKPKYIEISMREQQLRLYVFRDIPMDTKFQPRTRKEISKIQWYKLSELPAFRKKGAQAHVENSGLAVTKFYMVAPFLFPLKKWINSQKKTEDTRAASGSHHFLPHYVADEVVTTEDDTWLPTHSKQLPYVPAIETLDGATRELQRLLKMQPPTQGLQPQPQPQPQPQEDKGSALLSILQTKTDCRSMHGHSGVIPHTPSHAISSDLLQPRNPHHHANVHYGDIEAQQPPPSFPIPPSQETPAWTPTASQPQSSSSYQPRNQKQQQSKLYYEQYAIVQSGGMESPCTGGQQHLGIKYSGNVMTAPMNFLVGQSASSSQPNKHPPSAAGAAKLSGASLALLNAFKRDTTPASPMQDLANFGHIRSSSRIEVSRQGDGPNVSELAESSTKPTGDQHRSALLGMFKKSTPGDAPSQLPEDSTNYQDQTLTGQRGVQLEKVEHLSLQQLQEKRGSVSQQLSLEQLSLQASSNQRFSPLPPHRETQSSQQQHIQQFSYPQVRRQQQQQQQQQQQSQRSQQPQLPISPFGRSFSQQPQPTRILQRGQSINDLNSPPLHKTVPPFNPQPASSQTGSGLKSPFTCQPGDSRYNVDDPHDQKKQLLSLFGKQHAVAAEQGGPMDAPRLKVPSVASKESETPISPAEQTFLLGYLQSVTKNA